MDNDSEQPPAPAATKPGELRGVLLLLGAPLAFFASCYGCVNSFGLESTQPWEASRNLPPLIVLLLYLGFCTFVLATHKSRFATVAGVIGFMVSGAGLALGHALSNFSIQRGRALRRGGKARFPGTAPDTDWCGDFPSLSHSWSSAVASAAAAGWRLNAATEAASVAAFSHLAQQLLGLGAPARLVEEAHTDALDEVRHARLCYGLARAFDGAALGPSPFPEATWPAEGRPTHASVGAECAVEACLLESASAKVAAALARHEGLPAPVRQVLTVIALDEARHGAHGFGLLEWCLEVGGAEVRTSVDRALGGFDVGALRGVGEDGLEALGLAGPALWRSCVAEARADLDRWLSTPGPQRRLDLADPALRPPMAEPSLPRSAGR